MRIAPLPYPLIRFPFIFSISFLLQQWNGRPLICSAEDGWLVSSPTLVQILLPQGRYLYRCSCPRLTWALCCWCRKLTPGTSSPSLPSWGLQPKEGLRKQMQKAYSFSLDPKQKHSSLPLFEGPVRSLCSTSKRSCEGAMFSQGCPTKMNLPIIWHLKELPDLMQWFYRKNCQVSWNFHI